MRKEKWRVKDGYGEKGRLVVDCNSGTLIADCYAASCEDLRLPDDYRKLAKRIALLPELEQVLYDVYDSLAWGHPAHTRAATLLDKLDKLKSK